MDIPLFPVLCGDDPGIYCQGLEVTQASSSSLLTSRPRGSLEKSFHGFYLTHSISFLSLHIAPTRPSLSYLPNRVQQPSALRDQGNPPLPLTFPSDCTSLSYSELPSSWLPPSDIPCYLTCGHSKARFFSPGLGNLSSTQFQPEPAGICNRRQLQVKKIAGAEGRAHRSCIASQRLTSREEIYWAWLLKDIRRPQVLGKPHPQRPPTCTPWLLMPTYVCPMCSHH